MRTLDDLRLSEGDLEQALRSSQLFDAEFYLSQFDPADLAKDGKIDPIVHFIRFGAKDNYDPHPLFRTSFYKEQLSDPIESDINPLLHFLMFGGSAGLN